MFLQYYFNCSKLNNCYRLINFTKLSIPFYNSVHRHKMFKNPCVSYQLFVAVYSISLMCRPIHHNIYLREH